ncbi:hypothetical protein GCM10010300_58520 [Streptomyces olivaceoviridis]|nr:hypothetical protein GCM10010300_58520 [Streptomyces olivaceoviridis]
MTALPAWMRPPRAEGWFAEDLDHFPEAPRHTELIDGALVFVMSPKRSWHGRLVTALTTTLMAQAPAGVEVEREMTIRLDARNRPEPDLLLTDLPYDPDRTWHGRHLPGCPPAPGALRDQCRPRQAHPSPERLNSRHLVAT